MLHCDSMHFTLPASTVVTLEASDICQTFIRMKSTLENNYSYRSYLYVKVFKCPLSESAINATPSEFPL